MADNVSLVLNNYSPLKVRVYLFKRDILNKPIALSISIKRARREFVLILYRDHTMLDTQLDQYSYLKILVPI